MFYVTDCVIYVYFGFVIYFTTWLKQFRYGLAKVLYYMCLYVRTAIPTATSAQRCSEDLIWRPTERFFLSYAYVRVGKFGDSG